MVAVDNLSLERWRELGATLVIEKVADHAKADVAYRPIKDSKSTRWYMSCCGMDFELILTGLKFWDTRSSIGGCGAVDLVMHLESRSFKDAVGRLTSLDL